MPDTDTDVLDREDEEELPPYLQDLPRSIAGAGPPPQLGTGYGPGDYASVAASAANSKPVQPAAKSIAGNDPASAIPAPSIAATPPGPLDQPSGTPGPNLAKDVLAGNVAPPQWKDYKPAHVGTGRKILAAAIGGLQGLRDPNAGAQTARSIAYGPQLEQLGEASEQYKGALEQGENAGKQATAARAEKTAESEDTLRSAQAENQKSEADSRVKAEKSPEIQAFDDYVKQGKSASEAYRQVMQDQLSGKPPTAEADKQWRGTSEQSLSDGTISPADRTRLAGLQREDKLAGMGPEIVSQVGEPPVPADFPKGKNDPAFKKADGLWGHAAENVKNQEAGAAGYARGAGYNETRPVQVLVQNKDGSYSATYQPAGEAEKQVLSTASSGQRALSQQAQIGDIKNASQKVRQALKAGGNFNFTPEQVAKLTLAMSESDPTLMHNEVTAFAASGLNPKQQDLVTWLQQLNERALSLRSIAGMGQGSETTRAAILRALPSIVSGNKQMANKQLDAFDNMVENLQKGVLGVNGGQGVANSGKTYTDDEVQAAAKAHGMTPAQIEKAYQDKGYQKAQ